MDEIQPHQTPFRIHQPLNPGRTLLQLRHRSFGMREKRPAAVVQPKGAGAAVEKFRAQVLLHPRHPAREGWLGDPQFRGGAGQVSTGGDRDEAA